MFDPLLTNFALWASLLSILTAQLIKIPWNYLMTKTWDWHWAHYSGGMPSSHTAAVSSLATSTGLIEGWDSSLFAMSTIFCIIVMYDATGVRRQAGMHAQIINRLVEDFGKLVNELRHINEKSASATRVQLKEILGHQPIEVFVGFWFGILVTVLFYFLWF